MILVSTKSPGATHDCWGASSNTIWPHHKLMTQLSWCPFYTGEPIKVEQPSFGWMFWSNLFFWWCFVELRKKQIGYFFHLLCHTWCPIYFLLVTQIIPIMAFIIWALFEQCPMTSWNSLWMCIMSLGTPQVTGMAGGQIWWLKHSCAMERVSGASLVSHTNKHPEDIGPEPSN